MKDTKIVLTGGSGDLGRSLMENLLPQGIQIVNVDPRPSGVSKVHEVQGSINDADLLIRAFSDCDELVHIAAWHGIHEVQNSKSREDFWQLNATGTFQVLESAARCGVSRVIVISSSSVLSQNPGFYGVTKLITEELARHYAQVVNMQIVCLRPRAFIPASNAAVYSDFLEWAAWYCPGAVHLEDVTRAVLCARSFLRNSPPHEALFKIFPVDGRCDFSKADLLEWEEKGPEVVLERLYPEWVAQLRGSGILPREAPQFLETDEDFDMLGYRPQYGHTDLFREVIESLGT